MDIPAPKKWQDALCYIDMHAKLLADSLDGIANSLNGVACAIERLGESYRTTAACVVDCSDVAEAINNLAAAVRSKDRP